MLLANQIAWFLNQLFCWNKFIKRPNFFHVDTNSQGLIWNFLVELGQEWVWPILCLDSKIACISRMNRWNELIFCMFFTQIISWLEIVEVSMFKNGCGQSTDGTLKLTVSEECTYRITQFFECRYRFTKIKSWSKV